MKKINHLNSQGFTLIELMIVVVIMAILAAIAIPSYQAYIRKNLESTAMQQIQTIASELERHKARNFNYLGFAALPDPVVLPKGSTGAEIKFKLKVYDGDTPSKSLTDTGAAGQTWVIQALSQDVKLHSFLISSTGNRCKKLGTSISLDCRGAEIW